MKFVVFTAMMALSIANGAVIYQPADYHISGPRALYRASNLGITHQAELLGFNEPVIIENLAPASVASSEPIFAAPQPIPALVVRPPSEVFGAHPAPSLPVTTYEASNAGVTHRAELIGFSHPVVIKNEETAPSASEAPVASAAAPPAPPSEPTTPTPPPEPTTAPPAPPAQSAEPALAAPSDLPVTTYEASNAGVTHRAQLVGFSEPVFISNLGSAPTAVAHEPATLTTPNHPAIYRAVNLGIAHESPLPGHTKSVFSENLEPAPAAQPASPIFVSVPAPFQQAAYRFF